jgi:hypothetical protein
VALFGPQASGSRVELAQLGCRSEQGRSEQGRSEQGPGEQGPGEQGGQYSDHPRGYCVGAVGCAERSRH